MQNHPVRGSVKKTAGFYQFDGMGGLLSDRTGGGSGSVFYRSDQTGGPVLITMHTVRSS
jgi:hypothetical protein